MEKFLYIQKRKKKLIPLDLFKLYLAKVPQSIENQKSIMWKVYTFYYITKYEKLSTKETSCLSTQNYSDWKYIYEEFHNFPNNVHS